MNWRSCRDKDLLEARQDDMARYRRVQPQRRAFRA